MWIARRSASVGLRCITGYVAASREARCRRIPAAGIESIGSSLVGEANVAEQTAAFKFDVLRLR